MIMEGIRAITVFSLIGSKIDLVFNVLRLKIVDKLINTLLII